MHYTTIPILLSVKHPIAILADIDRDRFKMQHIHQCEIGISTVVYA